MTRINVYTTADDSDYAAYDAKPELLGWFDTASAELFEQDKRWDGSNMVGVITGSQWVDEYLYRTKGGRWVRNRDARRYMNGPDTYEFITDEQARDWLLRSEANDEAAERFFGPVEDERGPGRPEIGGAVHVRFGEELLAMVDAYAAGRSISRAEAIRRLTQDAVTRARVNDTAPLPVQAGR
jgi:hypothetical protein